MVDYYFSALANLGDRLGPEFVKLGVIWYAVFMVSVTCHEGSHALIGRWLGDRRAQEEGLVTLNPAVHMRRSPFGMVLVPVITYLIGGWMMGWASVPYSPGWSGRYPKRAALMALAGPAANLILVVSAGLIIRTALTLDWWYAPERVSFTRAAATNGGGPAQGLVALVSILFTLNLVLLLFNLMPAPPLDGSAAVTLLLPDDLAQRWREAMLKPGVAVLAFIIVWQIFPYVFRPLHLFVLNLVYAGITSYG